jgi:hypothetical protein
MNPSPSVVDIGDEIFADVLNIGKECVAGVFDAVKKLQ